MRHNESFRNVGQQLENDRLVRDSVEANPLHAHRRILRRNRHVSHNLRHGAMEVRIRAREVGDAAEEIEGLAHDVSANGRMQRRKALVAFHLINHLGRNELVVLKSGCGTDHSVADGCRCREVAGVEQVGNQLECDRAIGQSRGSIHQLVAFAIFDPELALAGTDAVDRTFIHPAALAVAGLIN